MSTTLHTRPAEAKTGDAPASARGALCFMETQFPVSKMSVESYKERKSNTGQTLTGLGKWWGRKPLVLCRATILGLLIPATDDPKKDREVFLRLMTMDADGLLRRWRKRYTVAELAVLAKPSERAEWERRDAALEDAKEKVKRLRLALKDIPRTEKQRREDAKTEIDAAVAKVEVLARTMNEFIDELQLAVFPRQPYERKVERCDRPEQIDGPSPESWAVINEHLGTSASSLPELVDELGRQRFGHVPRVGDTFSGGGSIPFEAARLGCDAYASDLNPVAAMLTWASLNIVGGGEVAATEVQCAQREVYDAVDRQVADWGVEHREPDAKTGRRWRADAYLYCIEATCPEEGCGWRVPLAPSWVIGEGTRTIARLVPDGAAKRFDFEVQSDVSDDEFRAAAEAGTVKNSELVCAHCGGRTPIRAIRGDGRGTFGDSKSLLRGWERGDIVPRESDIFGERLYCVRWVDTWVDTGRDGELKNCSERYYLAPTKADLKREQRTLELLGERFSEWQKKGYIPNRRIEPGYNTTQPIRERGWTHWHHLFNARQLLLLGSLCEAIATSKLSTAQRLGCLLGVFKCADHDSRLSGWSPLVGKELVDHVFANQALNTVFNNGARAFSALETCWFYRVKEAPAPGKNSVVVCDGRAVEATCDLWVTDPPYADAVNYEEISEFFLMWATGIIPTFFPDWVVDSRRALAVKGEGEPFKKAMVDCYRRMREKMPDDGFQVVMFTHQDAGVWADLALILWAAGLCVTAAWCIATETESALKTGNYVQGTVLLVLRKKTDGETAFLDQVYQDVEAEVRHQLDAMHDLDDARDPNFADTDYQLAAYAAALRVLTSKHIEDIDVAYELTRTRVRNEKSPLEALIERAVQIACDHLVPRGIEPQLWKSLGALERLYLKGLELESHGERRSGVYQELARGFGVEEYTPLLASMKANETRLKTASEFGRKDLGSSEGFGATLVRHALFAAHKTAQTESPREGITWLTTEVPDYAANRSRILALLEYFAALRQNASLEHWHRDAEAAAVLAGALRNRQDNV